jgi:protein-S-isoprenylcysteine O-methyltransferase Ste14
MKASSKTKQHKVSAKVKIQPPILVAIHVVLAFVLTWLIPLPLVVPPVLQTIGFLLVTLGFLLGIAALIAFRRARTMRKPDDSGTPLITSGMYRFTRNPVNLGFLLMEIGIPLNAGSYWGILLAPIMVILFNRLVIEPEEEYLIHKFGDDYRRYRSKVKRWI